MAPSSLTPPPEHVQDLVDDADYAASQRFSASSSSSISPLKQVIEGRRGGKVSGTKIAAEDTEVVFIKDNVSVHPTQNVSQRINGRLRLLKQGPSLFMTWIPYTQRGAGREGASGIGIGKNSASSGRAPERDRNLYTIRAVALAEIRSIRRHTPPLGWQYIIIVLTSGLAHPPLYFHNGGVREFLATLKEHVHIVRSAEDANVYLVNDITQDPLQRSLTSLELRDVVPVATTASPSSGQEQVTTTAPSEQPAAAIQCQEGKEPEEANGDNCNSLENSEFRQRKSRDPARDISIQVLEKFSLVTKFARETTAQLFGESRILGTMDGPEELDHTYRAKNRQMEMKPITSHVDTSQKIATSNASDDSLQCRGRRKPDGHASTNVGIFELVDGTQVSSRSSALCIGVSDSCLPLTNDTPTLVWGRARLPPLGSEEWATFLESEGRVVDSKALRKRIFYGGIEHGLRREIWKFLLGHYPFDSTYKEREELVARKYEEYRILKAQWQTVSEDQAKRFAKFRERKSRIEKDVVRTDRGLSFYAGDDNPNVTILRDILITYSFYNFDLGYCQGMSDFLSPILFVMDDESESFWCFAALMEHLAPNFHRDQNGMHSQLLAVSKLVQLLDSPLHNYLRQADCLNYFFCFRWILIQFKREFEYENVMRLWEVLWTHYLSEHFHLYMSVALLKRYRKKIIEEQMDFDTLLKFINELSGHIDLETTLRDAEALCVIAGDLGTQCIPPGTPPALPVPENNGI